VKGYKVGDRVIIRTTLHPCRFTGTVSYHTDGSMQVRFDWPIRGYACAQGEMIISIERAQEKPIQSDKPAAKKPKGDNPFKKLLHARMRQAEHTKNHADESLEQHLQESNQLTPITDPNDYTQIMRRREEIAALKNKK
jgi:hypothetical protein